MFRLPLVAIVPAHILQVELAVFRVFNEPFPGSPVGGDQLLTHVKGEH